MKLEKCQHTLAPKILKSNNRLSHIGDVLSPQVLHQTKKKLRYEIYYTCFKKIQIYHASLFSLVSFRWFFCILCEIKHPLHSFFGTNILCYFSSWKTCWQTATFLCGAACLRLVLSSFGSSHSVRASAAALASVPDLKRATGGYLFIIWHHTHIYIQTPLLLYLFWERSREVVCVARFCSRRGTRPAAQSPSEAAAGFSELSKLDLPSSFQSFVFLCFHVKWLMRWWDWWDSVFIDKWDTETWVQTQS